MSRTQTRSPLAPLIGRTTQIARREVSREVASRASSISFRAPPSPASQGSVRLGTGTINDPIRTAFAFMIGEDALDDERAIYISDGQSYDFGF